MTAHHKRLASTSFVQILAHQQAHVIQTKNVKSLTINQFALKVKILTETLAQKVTKDFTIAVCQCQKQSDCRGNAVCNGCDCIEREFTKYLWKTIIYVIKIFYSERDPTFPSGCEHCPPGVKCDQLTGACIKGK